MKKRYVVPSGKRANRIALVCLCIMLFSSIVSCDFGTSSKDSYIETQSVEMPVTIKKQGDSSDITSFQADVKVYEENSKKPGGRILRETYRYSMKLINGNLFTRIDYPEDDSGMARSVLNTPDEMCVFDRKRNTVQYRCPVAVTGDESRIQGRSLFGRISAAQVKESLSAVSCRITSNTKDRIMKIEFAQDELRDILVGGSPVISELVYYDTELEVPCGVEYTVIDEKGVKIQTVETDLFQESDGIPVSAGKVVKQIYTYPSRIDVSDREIVPLESAESVALMSEEQFKSRKESGEEFFEGINVLGDPGNRDYVVTVTEQYGKIDLNTLSDSFFRICF